MPVSDTARALVRRRAEAQMTDSVTVRRGSFGEMNPITLKVQGLEGAAVIYAGIARAAVATPSGTYSVGEGQLASQQLSISVPANAPELRVDDVVTIDATTDSDLAGEVWRIIGLSRGGGFNESRKFNCAATVKSRYWTGTPR